MKTNEKKPGALFNFFGCKAMGIKKSFSKSSKRNSRKVVSFILLLFILLNFSGAKIENNQGDNCAKTFFLSTANAQLPLNQDTEDNAAYGITPDGQAYDKSTGKTIEGPSTWSLPFRIVLVGILNAMSELLKFSGLLLDKTLNQSFFRSVIENEGIYRGWVVVRDVLNIFFMLLLLFSAFATIFQVEKYHLRKVIIMLVVMALLVNFSFPIALFIIDFSNSAMYFLIESAFGTTPSPSANIADVSRFADGLVSAYAINQEVSALILNIVLVFMLFVTFFAIGINFLIRILAFAILLILAPAGFTFAFFPGTKSVANEWWSALIKYAFLGPIMAFFLYIAIMIFDGNYLPGANEYFAKTVVRFIIPVTFLWMGLIISQKFGGHGSAMAMNFAKKTGGWIKTSAQGAAVGAVILGANSTGVPGALKQRYSEIKGGFNKSREDREAKVASAFGSKGAMSDLERKRYKESLDKMKGFSSDDLKREATGGNIAAAEELLNRKALDVDTYQKAINSSKQDQKRKDDLTAKFKGANKENRIDIVASIDARSKAAGAASDTEKEQIIRDEVSSKITKLNGFEFAKQDFENIWKEIQRKGSGDRFDKAESNAMSHAIQDAFWNLNQTARADIAKNISGNQRVALKDMGIIV